MTDDRTDSIQFRFNSFIYLLSITVVRRSIHHSSFIRVDDIDQSSIASMASIDRSIDGR